MTVPAPVAATRQEPILAIARVEWIRRYHAAEADTSYAGLAKVGVPLVAIGGVAQLLTTGPPG